MVGKYRVRNSLRFGELFTLGCMPFAKPATVAAIATASLAEPATTKPAVAVAAASVAVATASLAVAAASLAEPAATRPAAAVAQPAAAVAQPATAVA